MANDDKELLPCPFCGGSASLSAWDVQCDSCGALVVPENGAQHEAGAIAAWNRRASTIERLPAIEQERDALREALDEFVRFIGGYAGSLNTRGAGIELDRLVRDGRAALNQSRTDTNVAGSTANG